MLQSPALPAPHRRQQAPSGIPSVVGMTSFVATLLGVSALAGWILDLRVLRFATAEIEGMHPSASLCVIALGGGLFALSRGWLAHRALRVVATAGAIMAIGLTFTTLGSYTTGVESASLDPMLFRQLVSNDALAQRAWRMAPNTAFSLALIGLTMLSLLMGGEVRADRRRWWHAVEIALPSVVFVVGFLAIVGHLHGITDLYRLPGVASMAPNSAVAVTLLSVSALFARAWGELSSMVLGDDAGALLARRFLPVAVVAPVLIGAARVWLERAGLVGSTEGTVIRSLLEVLVLLSLVLVTARRLRRIDVARLRGLSREREAGHAAEQMRRQLSAVLDALPVGVFVVDAKGRITNRNQSAVEIWGGSPVVLGFDDYRKFRGWHPESKKPLGAEDWLVTRALLRGERGSGERIEIERFCGGRATIVNHAAPLRDEHGGVIGAVTTMTDVSAQVAVDAARQAALDSERAKLAAVIDALPVGVGLGTPDGTTMSMNRAGLEIHGFESEAEMFTRLDAYVEQFELLDVDGSRIPLRDWPIARAMRGEYVRDFELRLRHRTSGRERFLTYDVIPVRDLKGVVETLVYVIEDLTEWRKAEVALRRSEERYALAARATSNAIWDWDLQRDTIEWNEGVTTVFGYSSEEVAKNGEWWRDAIHPDDRVRVTRAIHAVIEGDRSQQEWHDAYRFRRKDGTWAHVVDRGYVARDEAGRAARMIGAMEDVTDRERAASEVARLLAEAQAARREAEAANLSKSQFLANMSHELRTPLNAITGHVQLMELGIHGPVTTAQEEALARVQKASRHLLGLITDILNYAKLEAGKVEFDVRQTLVADVVRDVLPLVEPQASAKGLRLTVSLPEDRGEEEIHVWADSEKLSQALLNLLSNAVKFTPPVQDDERQGCIAIELHAHRSLHDVACLRVRDTGIGIARERFAEIFEPFVQVRTGLTRAHEGTGLGLAISRDLARGMGGDLTVESTPGRGSTFTLELKRAAAAGGIPTDRRTRHDRRRDLDRRREDRRSDSER